MAEDISERPPQELQTLSQPASPESLPAICRICLSPETAGSNPLIMPCSCRGTAAHIHISCLKRWVEIQGLAEPRCEICKSALKIRSGLKTTWSVRPLLHSTTCLLMSLIVPISVVLIVVLVLASQDLSDSRSKSEVIGCSAALGVIAVALGVFTVCSCRMKRVYVRGVLPISEESEQNMTVTVNLA